MSTSQQQHPTDARGYWLSTVHMGARTDYALCSIVDGRTCGTGVEITRAIALQREGVPFRPGIVDACTLSPYFAPDFPPVGIPRVSVGDVVEGVEHASGRPCSGPVVRLSPSGGLYVDVEGIARYLDASDGWRIISTTPTPTSAPDDAHAR